MITKKDMVFRSKVDLWIVLLIYGLTLASVVPLFCVDFSIAVLVIVCVVLLFCTLLLFNIKYVVDGKLLIIKVLFISIEYSIDNIREIKSTKTFLSAPAASLDRIEIVFKDKSSVVISPARKTDFVEKLRILCSHEIKISV